MILIIKENNSTAFFIYTGIAFINPFNKPLFSFSFDFAFANLSINLFIIVPVEYVRGNINDISTAIIIAFKADATSISTIFFAHLILFS